MALRGRWSRADWLRRSLLLGMLRVRRVVRHQTASPARLLILGLVALVLGGTGLGGAYLLALVGEAIAAGDVDPGGYLPQLRTVPAAAWMAITSMVIVRAASSRGADEATSGLLVTVSTRSMAAGVLCAEFAVVLPWVLAVAGPLSVGLALGLGSPLPALLFPGAAVLVTALAVAVGYPIGLGVRHVVTRFPTIRRYRTHLAVVVMLAYFAAISADLFGDTFLVVSRALAETPPGWIADVTAVAVPGLSPSPLKATLALGQLLVVAGAVAVTTWIGARHWFADPVHEAADPVHDATDPVHEATSPVHEAADPVHDAADAILDGPVSDEDRGGSDGDAAGTRTGPTVPTRSRTERALASRFDRTEAALVVTIYRRARRAPSKLLYAAFPFFFLIGYVPNIVVGSEIPRYLPVAMVFVVAWGAGAAFVLNPLGDQGNVLPAAILAGVSGRHYVRGYLLASLLVTVPVAVVLPTAAAAVSPLGPAETVAIAGLGPLVVLGGSLAAVGIGAAAPRFDSVTVTRSRKAVVPSRTAFVLYTLYLTATVVVAGLVADPQSRIVVARLVSVVTPLSTSPGAVGIVAGLGLAGLVLAPVGLYRYAVDRFDAVTLESAGA